MITLNDYHNQHEAQVEKEERENSQPTEEKEYAIIITRRAAEQRSQRLLSGCIFVCEK